MSNRQHRRPVVAVFSGLDPTGGAGLVADIQALTDAGVSIAPVLTANTIQGTDHRSRFIPTSPDFFQEQASGILNSSRPRAVKIGMTGSVEIVTVLFTLLNGLKPPVPVVMDPVKTASSGARLASPGLREKIRSVGPGVTILTPNRQEIEWLAETPVETAADLDRAVNALAAYGFDTVLVKGGHFEGDPVDRLYRSGRCVRMWTGPRYRHGMRGTGCRLASFTAGRMAWGDPVVQAVERGYEYVQDTLKRAQSMPHES